MGPPQPTPHPTTWEHTPSLKSPRAVPIRKYSRPGCPKPHPFFDYQELSRAKLFQNPGFRLSAILHFSQLLRFLQGFQHIFQMRPRPHV